MELKQKNTFLLSLIFSINFLALIFQVLWVREITAVFGSSALSISIVLSVFLGGIALGAYLGGKLIGKFSHKYKILAVAFIVLGFYCLMVPFIFDFISYPFSFIRSVITTPLALNIFKFVFCFFVLIVPTTIIGAMFPVVTYLYSENSNSLGKSVASVYLFDTIGATLGAIVCGFIFVPFVGLFWTNTISAIIIIVLGFFIWSLKDKEGFKKEKIQSSREPLSKLDKKNKAILAILFVSGFSAILLEVIWIRYFQLLFSSSNYAFSLVVGAFLFGLAVGSLIIRSLLHKIKNHNKAFSYISVSIAVFSLLVLASYKLMAPLYFYFFGAINNFYLFQIILFSISFLLMSVPTILMGMNFPLALQIFSRSKETRGFDTGIVFSFNTSGGILGSFAAGFLIIPSLGLWQASVLASVLYIIVALLFLFIFVEKPFSQIIIISAAAAFFTPILFFKSSDIGKGVSIYHAAPRDLSLENFKRHEQYSKNIFFKHGFYGLVTVSRLGDIGTLYLRNNGKTDASTSEGDSFNQIMLGHKAFFFHKNPKKILNIGLGGGFTLGAINTHLKVEQIDTVEIDPLVVEAVEKHFAPYNNNALADSRGTIYIEDGRHFIDTTSNKYDIIISEPPNIWVSGVSRLFTREFYSSASNRLNEGGILIQWVPGYELKGGDFNLILDTIRERFQYVKYWHDLGHGDIIIMASHDSYKVDRDFAENILQDPPVVNSIMKESTVLTYDKLFNHIIDYKEVDSSSDYLQRIKKVNTDDLPYLEFSTARNLYYLSR